MTLERLSLSFGVAFGLQEQLNSRGAQMTPKASVDPLALYFQSHFMSLNPTLPNWSLQQVKSAESAVLGKGSYGKKNVSSEVPNFEATAWHRKQKACR